MPNPKVVVEGVSNFRKVDSDLARTESKLGKLGHAARVGTGLAFAAAGAAVVKFGIDSVRAASDSQQSIGATESVFGKYADVVIRRSHEAAESVGLSANEYRELADVTGAMLASAGTPLRKVADLTDKLEHRAADMAATFGGTTSEAIEAVSALLRGETDPIERYGVSIKQSDINARLAADGLDKLTGKAGKQAAQQERLKLLFDQTSKSSGQFARESDTLAGSQQRLSAKFQDIEAKVGTLVLPALTDLAGVGSDALDTLVDHADDVGRVFGEMWDAIEPAVTPTIDALKHLSGEGDNAGHVFEDQFLPALHDAAEIIGGLVHFVDELPGPVKELGAQGAVAALALSQMNRAMVAVRESQFISTMSSATGRVEAFTSAAKAAAGTAGMLALLHSANETNDGMKILERTLGATLTGLAVGGPAGGGIGLVAGLATSFHDLQNKIADMIGVGEDFGGVEEQIARQENAAADAAERHKTALEQLRDTMEGAHDTSRSLEPAYANLVAQLEAGGISASTADRQWKLLGISQRTVAEASLGNAGAMRRVNKAYESAPLKNRIINEHVLSDAIDNTRVTNQEAIQAERQRLRLTQEWGGKLRSFPKEARTAIRLDGVQPTLHGIAKITEKYDLTPKQVKTILEVTGVDATVKDVKGAQAELDKTGKKHPKPQVDLMGLPGFTANVDAANSLLVRLDGKRADTYIYTHHVDLFERGGGGGGGGGGAGGSSNRVIEPSKAVADAEATGERIGEALARGITTASTKNARTGRQAGRNILAQILAGVVGGTDAIRSALDKVSKYIEQHTKDDKAGNARQKQILKGLADEYAALVRNGKAQDEINRKLEKAKQHLQEVQGWVNQVKQSFIDTGNITQLGQQEDGSVSGQALIDQLKDKVEKAQRFAALIRKLTKEGLSKQSIQQLLEAGPDAGLATAEALDAGGQEAVDQINQLSAQLGKAGEDLGSDMSKKFFDVGLQASLGIVKGLEAHADELDRVARRLANRLAQAVRHALGIHSPSKEFADIGAQVMAGLSIGLDDTYAKVQGKQLASALVDGFASPTLEAGATNRGGNAATIELTVNAGLGTDGVKVGRQIIKLIQEAEIAGGRRRAVGPR